MLMMENFTPETPYGRFALADRSKFAKIIADGISNNNASIRNSVSASLCLKQLGQQQMLKLFQLALSSTSFAEMINKTLCYLSKVNVLNGKKFLHSVNIDLHLLRRKY
jgi:hypothetical protein